MGYLYDYGLPFSKKIGENIDDCLHRIDINKASMIIIDGGIGEGKTTLAVQIADYINKKNGLPPINFEDQIALGGDEFKAKLRKCYNKKLPVVIYDESGDFNRRQALTRFNLNLNRTFEMYRAFKIIVILCLPLFIVLDTEIFNKRIPQLLLHLRNRTEHQGEIYGYSLYRMFYVKDKMKKLIVKPFAYNLVEPNFYGHFLNLPPDREKELSEYSIKGKLDFLGEAGAEIEGYFTIKTIAKKMGYSLRDMRHIIANSRIKPYMKAKGKNFYSEDQFYMIADYGRSTPKKHLEKQINY